MSAAAVPDVDHVLSPVLVVGVDGTDRSADAAALGSLLAEAFGYELQLVHVLPASHLERAPDPVVPARQTVFARSPADGLRAVAEDGAVRALVLGSSHRGPIGRVLPGGVGRRLLATSTCPIIVAPVGFASRRPAKIDHIGCGFDGSPESRAAWVEACRVADVARAALHVYAIRETHAFVMATGPMIGSDPAGLDQAATEVLQRELMELVNAAPDHLFIEPIMRSGDPATVLREVAHELDLLVVGSRQMSRFGAMLLGSVSAKLMASADCPVMVVPGSLRTPDELR